MFVVVLVGALIAQTGLAAPLNNCAELCDDQTTGSFGQSKSSSSYSSYSKSSYGQGMQGLSGTSNLGLVSGRLENLDENVIGTSGLDRPGNWQDEKHYVTDDGKGQMSYRAGQTVSNNGYSKYAQHSYSYGSHESHAPLSNSQVLSTEQFGRELQSMRNRINSFMGNFHLGIGSNVNANLLQDFKSKANLISNQLNNVCNQVDAGSSMYQQMQLVMNQFQHDVDQKQREMESIIYQNSGSSSSSTTHGSAYRYPTIPSAQYEDQFSRVQSLISSFYSTFNRPDTNVQFQQDLNSQVDVINTKLADLNYEFVQNESDRKRIDHLKKQFETYVSQIRTRIQEIEQRNQEEEAKRKDRELQLKLEKQQQEEKLRQEELLRIQQQEEERIRLQQQEEERIRMQHQEEERLRLQHQQEEENKRIRQEQEERERLALLQQQQSKIKISGSSTYEHSMTGSYGTQAQTGNSGYTESYNYSGHNKPQPVIQPHIDLTAAMSRLQQDLNRLQTEVNNFNMYTMRLTSANSLTIVNEAKRQAEQLRERINNLCETSNRYQNHNIQVSAEDLGRRFEELFRSFQNQAANYSAQSGSAFSAGYSSESSYGTSGHYGAVRSPSITNVEYEHSKSLDVEVGRRPGNSQSYVSGPVYGSTNSYGAHGVDGQYRTGLIELGQNGSGARQVECVEMYAGQPCVEQPRRSRRYVGEEYDSFSDLSQQLQDSQQHQQIFTDLSQRGELIDLPRQSNSIRNKIFNQQTQKPTKPQIQNLTQQPQHSQHHHQIFTDLSQHGKPLELPHELKPIQNKVFNQQIQTPIKPQIQNLEGRQTEDLTRQKGDFDDFYTRQTQYNQENFPRFRNLEFEPKNEDLSQQNINLGLIGEIQSLEKLQNKNLNITYHTGDQMHLDKTKNLGIETNFENIKEEQNNFNYKFLSQQEILNVTTEPSRVRPITTFETPKSEKEILKPQIHPLLKLEFNQENDKFTLENSGFDNYQQQNGKPKMHLVQPTYKMKELESAEKLDFTLEKSEFNDYSNKNKKLKLNSRSENVNSLAFKNVEIGQETEDQVNNGKSTFRNNLREKSEQFGTEDFSQETQRSVSQLQLNLKSEVDDVQNPEFEYRNKHPTGQYIDISSEKQQSSYNFQVPESYLSDQQLKTVNSENIFITTEKQELTSTAHSIVKPLIKPVPRYTRPWQVSQIHTIPKESQKNKKQIEYENIDMEQNLNHINSNKPSTNDLLEHSKSSTTQLLVDDKLNDDYQKSLLDYDFKQQYQQINLNENNQLHDLQKLKNYIQIDHELKPTKFNQEENSTFQFNHNKNKKNNFENVQQQESNNSHINSQQFEQKDLNQQTQYISFDKQFNQLKFNQQEQKTFSKEQQLSQNLNNNLTEGTVSLDKARPINSGSEIEPNTTPNTFWKRVGHKLSDSINKVKEKAKTIFG